MTIRICGWSGPRNLSTALMRAFENRADCAVWDEPFYAAYLLETGADHPGRAETLASWPSDRAAIARGCAGPAPDGAAVFYQKQMTHHVPAGADLAWTDACRHFFLIRDPAEVIASYAAVRPDVTAEDVGVRRQRELFEAITARQGGAPPVIDARDLRTEPESVLTGLCAALDIPFDRAMLAWQPGPRASDGPWAPYWYADVERSTGFAPWTPSARRLTEAQAELAEVLRRDYDAMAARG